jgi:hypothetical protein
MGYVKHGYRKTILICPAYSYDRLPCGLSRKISLLHCNIALFLMACEGYFYVDVRQVARIAA